MSSWSRLSLVAVAYLALGAVGPAALGADECFGVALTDVSEAIGLDFRHRTGASGMKHLPETMGAGLAWLDFDGDGWQDLYLVQSGPFPPVQGGESSGGSAGGSIGEPVGGRLLRNVEGRGFIDVSERSASGVTGYGQGALAADLDGDGPIDLLVTNFGPDVLLRNRGDGSFERRAWPAGDSGGSTVADGWSASAAAADGDGDGDLDVYVSHYVEYDPEAPLFCGDADTGERRYCDPLLFGGVQDRYYRNEGEGRWSEVTAEAGLVPADGRGLGVVFSDLDLDGDPDLYVANDLTPNTLFENLGDGRFEDVSLLSGSAVDRFGAAQAGMGIALADVDGDRLPDLLVTNFDVETNAYYRNQGGLVFSDLSAPSGFGPPSFNYLAFGIGVADFNGDGSVDVYVANGHIFEHPNRDNTEYRQRDQILVGSPHGDFREARCEVLDRHPTVARGLALGDFDGDGDADIAVQENGGPARLVRNDASSAGWLGVRLLGQRPNTEAVGARVSLITDRGVRDRWVVAGDSYLSTSDRRVLFTLAPDERVERLEVRWPSGAIQALDGLVGGRYVNVAAPGSPLR